MLSDADLAYDAGAEVPGRYGKLVHVDFAVQGARSRSLVLTLGSQNASAAHGRAVEVFRSWHDLDVPERTEQRVTMLDDRSTAYRDDDLRRLEDYSTVVGFSDRTALRTLLAA